MVGRRGWALATSSASVAAMTLASLDPAPSTTRLGGAVASVCSSMVPQAPQELHRPNHPPVVALQAEQIQMDFGFFAMVALPRQIRAIVAPDGGG